MRKTKKPKPKNGAAVAMAQLRWKGVKKTERRRLAKAAVAAREQKREERKAKERETAATKAA